MINTLHHPINYQREVWILINKFDTFDIEFIPDTDNFEVIMLIDEASNLKLDDGSNDMKFYVDTCMPLIPSTNSSNLNYDRHTSKVSIVNEEEHVAFLQALVSDQNFEIKDILENHFGIRTHTKEQ